MTTKVTHTSNDPIAKIIQQELADSIITTGSLADLDYFGERAALLVREWLAKQQHKDTFDEEDDLGGHEIIVWLSAETPREVFDQMFDKVADVAHEDDTLDVFVSGQTLNYLETDDQAT